jgi:hypothetical protein
MSPELFDPEIQDHRRTKYSDCYALGMVVYEVLSGRVPFYRYANLVIPGMVFDGKRPGRPEGLGVWFTDDVWAILERCWAHQPDDRPDIKDVLRCLEEVSIVWTPPPQMVAGPSITDSPTRKTFDLSTEQSTGGGEVSSPSQVAPSQPSEKPPPEGDADDSSLYTSAHEFSVLSEAPDYQGLGAYVEGPNDSDLEGSAGIANRVGWATVLDKVLVLT